MLSHFFIALGSLPKRLPQQRKEKAFLLGPFQTPPPASSGESTGTGIGRPDGRTANRTALLFLVNRLCMLKSRRARQQVACVVGARRDEDVAYLTAFDNAAAAHHHDPVSKGADERQIMGDEQ
jgi:hypothetical protein